MSRPLGPGLMHLYLYIYWDDISLIHYKSCLPKSLPATKDMRIKLKFYYSQNVYRIYVFNINLSIGIDEQLTLNRKFKYYVFRK